MSYKLVVTDMDGTFLNSNHKICDENLKVVEALRKKGILFSVATGRLDTMVKAYLREIGNDTPVISCNGALVRNLSKREYYHADVIKKEAYLKVIEICKAYNAIFHVYSEYVIYSESREGRVKFLLEYNETLCDEDKMDIRIVENIYEDLGENEEVFKILVVDDNLEVLEKIKKELNEIEGIDAYKSASNLLDVMKDGVTKGNALRELAEILGIKREEIIAIGDNHNDLSMLEYAGFAIAMGNAEQCVKDIANLITDSNDENGVAKALNWVLDRDASKK